MNSNYQGNRFVKPFEYGYFSMAAHIVLLLITFGIWWFIWVYRTTDYLNRLETEPSQTPVCQMLLCLIPFYSIYWTYKNADRIDKYAFQNNTNSDITLLSVILAIFVQIVAAIIMQDKLNEIIQPRMRNNYQHQSERASNYTYANAGGTKSSQSGTDGAYAKTNSEDSDADGAYAKTSDWEAAGGSHNKSEPESPNGNADRQHSNEQYTDAQYAKAPGLDMPSTGLNVLSFFFPIVGLILYLVWKDEYPLKAGGVGKWALVGFCVSVGISIIGSLIGGCTATMFCV